MTALAVAAFQFDPKIGEVEANLKRIEEAAREAAGREAVLVVAPEASITGYAFESLEEAVPVARHADAIAPDRLSAVASEAGITVIAGSLEAFGDAVHNVALIALPNGHRLRYRKLHLPFLGVDRFATPGDQPPFVFELDNGLRIGVLICYDLRFPEAARVCALEGADLICLPTNWPVGVEFHPDLFAPARAAENHCYVLAADRIGEERGTRFLGRSLLVDPDGRRLIVASDTDEELLVGHVDPDAARATHVRRRPGIHEWDTIADRRPGLYERLLAPGIDRLHPPSATVWSGDTGDGPSRAAASPAPASGRAGTGAVSQADS